MAWEIRISETADRQLSKLGHQEAKRIREFLRKRVAACDNPRDFGDPLYGNFAGLWRYRVGDYRVICQIEDEKIYVLVALVGHRRDIYR